MDLCSLLAICTMIVLTSPFLFLIIASAIGTIGNIFKLILRSIVISIRGWPPAHLETDADFGLRQEEKEDA